MNRHERRKQAATGNRLVDNYVRHLPQITQDEAMQRDGLTHVVMRHDEWCRVLKEGGGMDNCNCNPQFDFHAEPVRS